MKTNSTNLTINSEAVDRDFAIYRIDPYDKDTNTEVLKLIAGMPSELMAVSRTKDSKKKGGKLHIYLLFEKDFDKTCLKEIENQTGCFATRIYAAGRSNGFYPNDCAQLLINSLHEKAIKRDYGNGDGMLLYSHPEWTNDYKGEFYRYGIQVKVEFNNIIALPVVTFK